MGQVIHVYKGEGGEAGGEGGMGWGGEEGGMEAVVGEMGKKSELVLSSLYVSVFPRELCPPRWCSQPGQNKADSELSHPL